MAEADGHGAKPPASLDIEQASLNQSRTTLTSPAGDDIERPSMPSIGNEKEIATIDDSNNDEDDIVDWDGQDDPMNPMNWPSSRKWLAISMMASVTFITAMAATIFAPGVPMAQEEFGSNSEAVASLLISVYLIGLVVGPLFLAPMSELYGRYIAIHSSNIVFLVVTILCAAAKNIGMLIAFRLIMGIACCVSVTAGGGVIADLIEREKRGRAMSIWIVGPLLGPIIGPVVGGYLSMNVSWRWTFWLLAILQGAISILCFIFIRETYAPRILERKTERLRRDTGNLKLRSKLDSGQKPLELFRLALMRPTKLLVRSPIVLLLSLFVSVAYSYVYLLFTTFTGVFESQYGFNTGEAGLAYIGIGIGFAIGQASAGTFSDWYIKQIKGEKRPEDRLPPLVLGAFILPVGLFWYGWSAQYRTHWIVPIIGTGVCGIGIMYVFLCTQLYLVDAFTRYAASAVAANVVIRSIFGTCIPLAGPALYEKLGLGWGNSLLGFIALAFAPTSLLLWKYGERIRKDPRFQPSL